MNQQQTSSQRQQPTSSNKMLQQTPSCPASNGSSLSQRAAWPLLRQRILTTSSQNLSLHQANRFEPALEVQVPVSSKFHRAAMDGYVDMLCGASKRETNAPAREHQLLTPTLLAAQSGQLEALRMLVGRGGDPECVSASGASALHLAAARNHLNCVSFLVNFGVNMWALDNELRTAKDLAALEQSKEVLDYLDQMMAKQSAINTKQVQKLKARAKRAADKRLKQMRKAQLKAIKQVERDERQLAKLSHQRRLLRAAHSISDIKLVGRGSLAAELQVAAKSESGSFGGGQPTLAHIVNQRQQADLLARARRLVAVGAADVRGNKSRKSPADDCEQFSSVSSTSGYLSSCSAKSAPLKHMPASRPKYSDLVAVGMAAPSTAVTSSKERLSSPSLPSGERPNDTGSSGRQSTFALRLRAIGGVSRKVRLRKLLGGEQNQNKNEPAKERVTSGGGVLKRAKSEPDFSALDQSHASTECDADCVSRADNLSASVVELEQNDAPQQSERDTCSTPDLQQHPPAQPPQPPPPPPPPPLPLAQPQSVSLELAPEGNSKHPSGGQAARQQHLLTQCLSQLKLQQEAGRSQCALAHRTQQLTTSCLVESDELLRHQMSAREFPIRPSIIKHQQKQQQQHHCDKTNASASSKPASSNDSVGSTACYTNNHLRNHHHHHLYPASNQSASRTGSISSELVSSDGHLSAVSSSSSSTSGSSSVDPQIDLGHFLALHGLGELSSTLERESIDLEALLLLTESDLKSLNILLGPRRKLLNAIERQKEQSNNNARFLVVDTQF